MSNNLLKDFEQNLAESQNEASHESALDLMNRVATFAMELHNLVQKYQRNIPDVLIDGVLLGNINQRAANCFRMAEQLARAAQEKP